MPTMRAIIHTLCALFISFVLLSIGSVAQQPTSWSKPAFSATPAELLEASTSVEKTKGYQVTVLMDDISVSVDDQGRTVRTYRVIFRPETPEAAKAWASLSVGWEPWRQKQPRVRARVITPDGVEHLLDTSTLSDAPARQDGTEVYSDTRIYRGPLPAVVAGAVVEEEFFITDTEPFISGGVVNRVYVGRRVPVHQTHIVLEAPTAKLRYELRLLQSAKVNKQEEGGRTRLVIEQGSLDPIEITDSNLPSGVAVWPHIEFTTNGSWKQVAETYREMSDPQIRVDDVSKIVSETIDPKQSQEEKIRKLTAYLHKEVRYTGIEFSQAKIVPQPPAEVFKRKYGDCKDKAATLVSMLRAAGIPAYIALLNSGAGFDVTPGLPGGDLFDHAIVYVPGKPDIWIDATDEYSPIGNLPTGDQGRYALVIREGTSELVRIPRSTATDNLLVENREYRLAEYGPATVIESSESHGFTDRNYRSYYGGAKDSKKLQKEIEEYTKSVYSADGETKLETSDGLDLAKPFVFRIQATKVQRAFTSLQDARAVMFFGAIAARLPEYFRKSDEDIEKEDARRERPRDPRTADFVLPGPFITEWRCKFVPPPGFKVRSIPEDKEQNLGPAKLAQHWESAADGAVVGIIRFDTVKGRYTAAEAESLRKAIVELRKANGIVVAFDQVGYSLLAAGKGKEALEAFESLVKLHPTESLHHVQISSALLEVGLGESARKEAREAVRLEPKSAQAHQMLGWVLQHDLVGRRLKKGFDLEAALAEYRTAIELDPEDNDIRGDYAILLEHDSNGERYSTKANLEEAIAQYRKLKDKKYTWEYLDGNLSSALFWVGKWKDVEEQVGKLSSNENNNAMLIAARTALEGAEAGKRRAAELTSTEKAKSEALISAANKLLLSRRYQDAAVLMEAAQPGESSLEMLTAVKNTKKYEELPVPANDAVGTVKKMLTLLIGQSTPDPNAADFFATEVKRDGKEGPVELDTLKSLALNIRYQAASEFPNDVRGDVVLSNIKLTSEGDDETGYRVMMQMMQLNGYPLYVVKTASGYKVLPTGNTSLGQMVFKKIEDGNVKAAKRWLDWAREENPIESGEDPLQGEIIGRLWKRGQNGDKDAMQIAAASLHVGKKFAASLLPIVNSAHDKSSGDNQRAYLDIVLFGLYADLGQWSQALSAAERLITSFPDSDTAFAFYSYACMKSKDFTALEKAARARLERNPDDEQGLMMLGEVASEGHEDFAKAMELLRPRISNPKASMGILNNYAWSGLFVSPMPSDVVDVAQRAARLTDNKDFGIVHTLAAIYAEVGRPAEARKLILSVMDGAGMDEPDGSAWYVFGRIAEQYGRTDAALAAYGRTRDPKQEEPSNNSSWSLAQRRMKFLTTNLVTENKGRE